MEQRDMPLRGSFLSLLDWKSSWIEQGRFPYTPSVSEIYSLESVLEQTLRDGMEAVVGRHQAIARASRAGVTAMGLDLWAESELIATACCTAVRTPEGVSAEDIISTLRSRYGVMISGGYGDLSGKLFRLGHMGVSAHPTLAIAQLGLIELALTDLGMALPRGAGVAAALEALAGWDDSTHSYPS
jgi:pyridoxamine--pyruvate transaminase